MGQTRIDPDPAWESSCVEELTRFICAQCSPPSTEPMWQWWEKNIVLDSSGQFPGPYRTDLTPMVRWLADWAQNPRVRKITGMGAAQTIKTQFLLNLQNWAVSEAPGTTMWVMADADSVREFWTKRLSPSIDGCEPTRKRFTSRCKDLISFDTMNLLLRGSQSRSKLQSDPVRRLICDERREWKKGSIDLVRKRTRTFNESQEVSVGTAGAEGDELHSDYIEGSQTMPHFRCLKCDHSQPFRFWREVDSVFTKPRDRGGLVYDKNETTRPKGVWNFAEVKKTVRYECENCGHRYSDDQKIELIRTLHPHDYNPAAPPDKKSLHWNALAFIWEKCHWGEIVEEYLRARAAAKCGNIQPLIVFYTETLGIPWKDLLGKIEDFGFLEARKGDYKLGDGWSESKWRFMAADRQEKGGEHYWYVIREFGLFGKSRLVAYGRCSTTAELEKLRQDYNVPIQNAMIDSGFKAAEVYRFCVSTGWKAFKGDDQEFFLSADPRTKRPVRHIWRRTFVDPLFGKKGAARLRPIPLFTWSNNQIKDRLAEFMTGLVGEWTIPLDTGSDYMRQVSAEKRKEREDSLGRITHEWKRYGDNHMFDCECMIMTAVLITKLAAQGVEHVPEPVAAS